MFASTCTVTLDWLIIHLVKGLGQSRYSRDFTCVCEARLHTLRQNWPLNGSMVIKVTFIQKIYIYTKVF